MKLVSAEGARQTAQAYQNSPKPHDFHVLLDIDALTRTVQALWLWAAEQDCDRGDFSAACDCIPCQARHPVAQAKEAMLARALGPDSPTPPALRSMPRNDTRGRIVRLVIKPKEAKP